MSMLKLGLESDRADVAIGLLGPEIEMSGVLSQGQRHHDLHAADMFSVLLKTSGLTVSVKLYSKSKAMYRQYL